MKQEQLIKEFESFDGKFNIIINISLVVRNVSTLMPQKNLLFIQFLLERKLLVPLMTSLLNMGMYLQECYEIESVMMSRKHRDYMLSLLENISKFEFRFSFPPPILKAKDQLIPQIKTHVREIIQYFSQNSKSKGIDLQTIGKDPKLKEIVKQLLCRSLLAVFYDGLLKKFFIGQTPWSIIIANFKNGRYN